MNSLNLALLLTLLLARVAFTHPNLSREYVGEVEIVEGSTGNVVQWPEGAKAFLKVSPEANKVWIGLTTGDWTRALREFNFN